MEQMAVWNAFDNNIITEFLEYEKKCKKTKQPMMTVEAFVRKKAVQVHKKEERERQKILEGEKGQDKEVEKRLEEKHKKEQEEKERLRKERRSR
jgi:hypothetical protein